MTEILYGWLEQNYPPIDGVQRIGGYPPPGGLERIYLMLVSKEFLPPRNLITIEELKSVAQTVFDDIYWEFFENAGVEKNVITFDSEKTMESGLNRDYNYSSSYDNHYIQLIPPFFYPSMEIGLGWRGTSRLHPRQREKYFSFVNALYDRFLQNSKNVIL